MASCNAALFLPDWEGTDLRVCLKQNQNLVTAMSLLASFLCRRPGWDLANYTKREKLSALAGVSLITQ